MERIGRESAWPCECMGEGAQEKRKKGDKEEGGGGGKKKA